MEKRDLVSISDLKHDNALEIFQISRNLKDGLGKGEFPRRFENRVLALIFEKPSLRTRVTFEVAILQLGGHAISMMSHEIGIGKRESCHDVAKNLERWVDIVAIRTYGQDIVEQLAAHSRIPVINALTDQEHPCQALADLYTLSEHFNEVRGLTLAFLGDGNNICNSLLLLCPLLGVNITVGCPAEYCPPSEIVEKAQAEAAAAGTKVEVTHDAFAAVRQADAIYTDVWASMGQESERDERRRIFHPYQVNAELVAHAPKGAKIMHDLPARRGEEITDDVIDSPNSIVFDQAENRLHVQKGIMVFLKDS